MKKKGSIAVSGWWLYMIILALFVTIGLFVKVNQIAYDTQVWNVAKATEIGYVIDVLPTLNGDAMIKINLEREKTFTLFIQENELRIEDSVNGYTYDFSYDLNSDINYQERDPNELTITKKGSEIIIT